MPSIHNYLRHGEGFTFVRWFVCLSVCLSFCLCLFVYLSVCVSVCLFVCLSVSNITEKNGWTDFREIFRIDGTWYMEHSTISMLAPLRKNGLADFMKFSGQVGYETRNNLKHLGMLNLTLWIQHIFFNFFLYSCLIATLWKNGWTDFHIKFSGYVEHGTTKRLVRLFHAWLDRSTVPLLGAVPRLLATLR